MIDMSIQEMLVQERIYGMMTTYVISICSVPPVDIAIHEWLACHP